MSRIGRLPIHLDKSVKASLAGGTWRNDLYDFSGTDNVGASVVESTSGVWAPAP